jgi:hypothetical protein
MYLIGLNFNSAPRWSVQIKVIDSSENIGKFDNVTTVEHSGHLLL